MGIDTRDSRYGATAAVILLTIAMPACVRGILYHDVVLPLDTRLNATPIGSKTSELEAKTLQNPIGPRIQIDWDSNAIGDVMKTNGLVKGYYADEKRFSILFGFFGYRRTVVSGD